MNAKIQILDCDRDWRVHYQLNGDVRLQGWWCGGLDRWLPTGTRADKREVHHSRFKTQEAARAIYLHAASRLHHQLAQDGLTEPLTVNIEVHTRQGRETIATVTP
jgi:hypothetical protein